MKHEIKGLSNIQLKAKIAYFQELLVECLAEVMIRSKRVMKKRPPRRVIVPVVKAPLFKSKKKKR